jgi:hypothetical protein
MPRTQIVQAAKGRVLMFCSKCGEAVQDNDKFCSSCGASVPATYASAGVFAPPTAPSAPSLAGSGMQPPFSPRTAGSPPGGRKGLIIGIVAAVVVILVGIGVGTYFLASRGDDTNVAVSTTVTTATVPSTTATTEGVATTADPTISLEQRAEDWLNLVESIGATGEDKTAELAAYLTPADQAHERAAEIQEYWAYSDPEDIIAAVQWNEILGSYTSQDGTRGIVVFSDTIACRDNYTTGGVEALSLRNESGTWMCTVDFEPASIAKNGPVYIGESVKVADFVWSPDYIQALKHLSISDGPTTSGMFVSVEVHVRNAGSATDVPSLYSVALIDNEGNTYGLSASAEDWWYEDAEDRSVPIAPGESAYLWYNFEVPEGTDLATLRLNIAMPII